MKLNLKHNKLKWVKELKEKEEVISKLNIKGWATQVSSSWTWGKCKKKLNILFQAEIIDIERNIIKKRR